MNILFENGFQEVLRSIDWQEIVVVKSTYTDAVLHVARFLHVPSKQFQKALCHALVELYEAANKGTFLPNT